MGGATLLTHGASWPQPGQRPLLPAAPASPSGSSGPSDAGPLLLPHLGSAPPPAAPDKSHCFKMEKLRPERVVLS